jgi:hypothetical protein
MFDAEMLKEVLDRYFFLKSEYGPTGKFSDRRKLLIYHSPSGVELFRIEIRLSDGLWLFSSITHTLSSQVHQLQDLCMGV